MWDLILSKVLCNVVWGELGNNDSLCVVVVTNINRR